MEAPAESKCWPPVQRGEQPLAHMKLLRQSLAGAGIAQLRNVLHILHFGGQLVQERSCDVLLRDGVVREYRRGIGRKLLPGLIGQGVGARQLFRLSIGAERLLGVLAELSVNFPRREVSAVQQHLKPDPDRCRLIPGEQLLSGKFGGVDRGRRELGATNRRRGKREDQPKPNAGRQ